MVNNPVQIVLNTENYINLVDTPPGKNYKDFYADRDSEFIAHKQKLLSQLTSVRKTFGANKNSPVEYVKVILQSDAWAKSHRPTAKVFDPKKTPCVGGDGIGEMFFEIQLDLINTIEKAIHKAEETTNWETDKNGKLKPKPSPYKSEVGAIADILIHDISDKRKFTIEQGFKWLTDPRTGNAYLVELFITEKKLPTEETDRTRMLRSYIGRFEQELSSLGLPIELVHTREKWNIVDLLIVRFNKTATLTEHTQLINYLEKQSIVKKIGLPPILNESNSRIKSKTDNGIDLPKFDDRISYASMGIIDTGVSETGFFDPWIIGRSDFLDYENQNLSHGTFIAGLSVASSEFNSHEIFREDPCQVFDLGLHPTDPVAYLDYYPKGFVDFLEQLDFQIAEAKKKGVRIFNMSLAVETVVSDDSYSYFAAFIDDLCVKHDVLFVISAGNLPGALIHKPWPKEPLEVLEMLVEYKYPGRDRIYQPAESVHSVTVGAVNPPNSDGVLIPAQYSRRGPGCALGQKPDLAHVGGEYSIDTGLYSLADDGTIVSDCGTSYAAPLVAKTLANINHKIQGNIPREALRALLIHYCSIPHTLKEKSLKSVARQFVGHGIPANSNEILVCEDYEITLVFNGTLTRRRALDFDFTWPLSLVGENGKCKGSIRMTLVYSPLIDESYGAEYVRVNLDGYLRQEHINPKTGEISFKGSLENETSADNQVEKERIENGAKWWPIKQYSGKFPKGKGNSSNWKLVVDSLTRATQSFPDEGMNFSVILTIADIEKKKPVFNQMRRTLQTQGAIIQDIKTALKLRT